MENSTKETPAEKTTFDVLGLSENVLKAVTEMGFEHASPIQEQAIPHLLVQKDVIGQAQTGTGKTAAFGIPMVEKVAALQAEESSRLPRALVLCPTRELALQVALEIKKIAKYQENIFVEAIYGGESIDRQIRNLKKGVQIVIGTPGRTIDHIKRGTLKLDEVSTIVLDEADEMLNMGFRDDIENVLEQLPSERQTVLFSATMPKPILQIAKAHQNEPEIIKVIRQELTSDNIEQSFIRVNSSYKMDVLVRLLAYNEWESMLIFCNTKRNTDEVAEKLIGKGFAAEALHGDLAQHQRNIVMKKFRHGGVKILVATDVAARGIDVDNVEAVINYDVPLDPEYYVHRIGRTGRAGNKGVSMTFISGRREQYRLNDIERYTKAKVKPTRIPTQEEIVAQRQMNFLENLKSKMSDVNTEEERNGFTSLVEMLEIEGFTAKEIATALLAHQISIDRTDNISDEDLQDMRRGRDERDGRNSRRDRNGRGRDRDRRGGRRNERGGNSRRFDRNRDDMVRLQINLGATQNVRKGDILGAIAGETGVRGNHIGAIRVNEKESFVDVPQSDVDKIIRIMNKAKIKGKKVAFAKA